MNWSWAYHRKLWVKKDRLSRLNYATVELKRLTLRSLIAHEPHSFLSRCYYSHLLAKLPRRVSLSFFRTQCLRTGSGRSVFRRFKYSRHELKRLSSKGLMVGFRKSSF